MKQIFLVGVAASAYVLVLTACSDGVECEPDSEYYNLFKGDKYPSNKEGMKHLICRDSDGNII